MERAIQDFDENVVFIKLGGSAITFKEHHEKINMEVLLKTIDTIKQFQDRTKKRILLVHGAGSFGHFEAKKYGISHGVSHQNFSLLGCADTRRSVTTLNNIVVSALVNAGLPAVGISPFPHWITDNRCVIQSNAACIAELLHQGLIPVLHGDVVRDSATGFGILSGDIILQHLCPKLCPQVVIFLSDVCGVYNVPPHSNDQAKLMERIRVNEDGSLDEKDIKFSKLSHDVTGGILNKINSAVSIINAQPDSVVYFAKAGSPESLDVLLQQDGRGCTKFFK